MSQSLSFHIKENLKLSIPVALGNMMHMITALADTIMVGRVGVTELAAVGFTNAVFMFPFLIGNGIATGITATVGKANGEKNTSKVASLFNNGIVLSTLVSIILVALLVLSTNFLPSMGQEKQVVEISYNYYYLLIASLPFYMLFLSFKNFFEGLQSTAPGMIILIIANLVNVFLNYVFIFGNFGFDAMGLDGAGWATLISRMLMLVLGIIFLFAMKRFKNRVDLSNFSINKNEILSIFKIGLPIGIQVAFEVGIFSMGTIIAGMIGAFEQAAHKIALDIAAFTFMIASGLGTSATISVSNYFGAKNKSDLKLTAYTAIVLGFTFMTITCIVFLTLNDYLPLVFTDNKEVLSIASGLLILAGFFQISDGLQVTVIGILRGMHDVKIPTLVTLISYWVIGIPIAYYLSITKGIGPVGIWYGYLIGLSLVAVVLFIRFQKLHKKLKW